MYHEKSFKGIAIPNNIGEDFDFTELDARY
jgi:hypothetical protein